MPGIGLFICVSPNNKVRRNHQPKRLDSDTGTVRNDKIAKPQQRFVLLPHRDVQEGISANDEKNAIAVAVKCVAEITHGIYGLMPLTPSECLTSCCKRRTEVR